MPKYPYLNDDTRFDAPSLNSRFTLVADALNEIGLDAIAERALNMVHVPSPVEGIVLSLTEAKNVDTPSVPGAPIEFGEDSWPAGTSISSPVLTTTRGYSATLTDALTLTRSTDNTQPTALMVMANVEIREFTGIEVIWFGEVETSLYGITLNEYEWDATVVLVCEDSTGTQQTLFRTERQVSPRVTIGQTGNDMGFHDPPGGGGGLGPRMDPNFDPPIPKIRKVLEGRIAMGPLRDMPGDSRKAPVTGLDELGIGPDYTQFDYKTFQDVAIRTVITSADLGPGAVMLLDDIKKVHIGFLSGNDCSYLVQRANITLIPLFAEVV